MNEQTLQALAKQAGFCGSDLSNTVVGTTHQTALTNFAELIVKECLTRIDALIHELDEYANADDGEFVARSLGAYQAKEAIEDHFGVE